MQICETSEHNQIVHDEGWKECPLCKALSELEDALKRIEELEEELRQNGLEF
jgi:hypothetical protein